MVHVIGKRFWVFFVSDVATTGKSYIDSIFNLSQSAQVCKGATSEIGQSFLYFPFCSS